MAGMCWPLRMQGKDTEESGVRGGGGGGRMLLPKQRQKRRGKNTTVYSLIVGLRGIWGLFVWIKRYSILYVMLKSVLKVKIFYQDMTYFLEYVFMILAKFRE
jgi:hypothetical protein